MTSGPLTSAPPPTRSGTRSPRAALLVIASAQLMVVLDGTIVNIALPSIGQALAVGPTTLAWIVNAYALAFGGLLLLGGRAGDLFGRRRMFRAGLLTFTLASLLGGVAPNEQLLLAARVLQGVGAAVVAPTALSLITTTFAEGRERGRAMGLYAAMSGLGATIGLLLGGVLTDFLSWRWVLGVNVPIGLAVLIGSRVLAEGGRSRTPLDVPGAVTGTAGLVALVYGISRAGDHGWTDGGTLAAFLTAAVLLAAFLTGQRRAPHPMLPLGLLRDRNRAGAYGTMLLLGAGMFATFYFLTLYMQQVQGYSAVRAGLAYLPFSLGMMVAAGALGPRLTARFAPRALVLPGLLLAAAGMSWFSRLTPDSSYLTQLAPAMLLTAFGLGTGFLPLTLSAVSGTTDRDAGIASGLLNAAQQIGGALGLAVLSTYSAGISDAALPEAGRALYQGLAAQDPGLVRQAAAALTDGYTAAFGLAAVLLVAAAVIGAVTLPARAADRAG
jgi:EmrB/QacA subfamily drug resistance transporter